MNQQDQPTAIDLFSGCGGLTEGLKQAGFRVIGAVDNDPLSIETYQVNHPDVEVWPVNIQEVVAFRVRRKLNLRRGELDLLAGCPPCQGFSSMRTLNGSQTVNDPRNDLILEFLRFVRALEPKVIMLENVPGLTDDERFAFFCKKLEALKYTYKWDILNAADYGVPQRRRRLILLACQFGSIDFAPKDSNRLKVEDVLKDLQPAGQSGDPLHDFPEKRSKHIMELIRNIPKDGGSRTDLGKEFQLACHQRCKGFKDVYGRMAWSDVAPTITGGCVNPSKGRFLHPEFDRAITLREAALLQSFPSDYFFSLRRGKYAAAALVGNALPPEFIRRHACKVLEYLREQSNSKQKHAGCIIADERRR